MLAEVVFVSGRVAPLCYKTLLETFMCILCIITDHISKGRRTLCIFFKIFPNLILTYPLKQLRSK